VRFGRDLLHPEVPDLAAVIAEGRDEADSRPARCLAVADEGFAASPRSSSARRNSDAARPK